MKVSGEHRFTHSCDEVWRAINDPQALARHKRPRELHFVPELPRNAMGKVQKAKLR